MIVDWNVWGPIIGSTIGAVISFILAIRLVYFKDRKKQKEENKKIKKLFEDLFNGFSKLYDNEGCILLFRTFPLILEDIQEKLQMITSFDYKKETLSEFSGKIKATASGKNPEDMTIWIYNHEWFFKLDIFYYDNFLNMGFNISLNNLKEKTSFTNNKNEILINFLTYLENEYRNANIIGKKEILLTDTITDEIKSYYSTKNGN